MVKGIMKEINYMLQRSRTKLLGRERERERERERVLLKI